MFSWISLCVVLYNAYRDCSGITVRCWAYCLLRVLPPQMGIVSLHSHLHFLGHTSSVWQANTHTSTKLAGRRHGAQFDWPMCCTHKGVGVWVCVREVWRRVWWGFAARGTICQQLSATQVKANKMRWTKLHFSINGIIPWLMCRPVERNTRSAQGQSRGRPLGCCITSSSSRIPRMPVKTITNNYQ